MILNKTSCKNPTLSHISAKPPVQSSTIFIAKIMRDVHNNQQLQGMLEIAVIKLFSPCSISLLTSALQLLPHSPLSSSHTASAFSSAIRPDLPPAFFLSPKKKNVLILISQGACSDLHTPRRTLIPTFLRAGVLLWSALGLWHLTHFYYLMYLVIGKERRSFLKLEVDYMTNTIKLYTDLNNYIF